MSEPRSKAPSPPSDLRMRDTDAGPYRTPAEIAAEMPKSPKRRRPFPWMRLGGIAALVQGPISIGVLYDIGSHGTHWVGVLYGLGAVAGILCFAAFVSFPAWFDR